MFTPNAVLGLLGKVPIWAYALVAIGLWGGYGHYKLNNLRAEVVEQQNVAALQKIKQLEINREEEQRRGEEHARIVDQERRGAAARAAADAAARSAGSIGRLQQRITALTASASACNTTLANGSTPAATLGELFGNCTARYRSLGEEAAACRTAGIICERAYDALRKKTDGKAPPD